MRVLIVVFTAFLLVSCDSYFGYLFKFDNRLEEAQKAMQNYVKQHKKAASVAVNNCRIYKSVLTPWITKNTFQYKKLGFIPSEKSVAFLYKYKMSAGIDYSKIDIQTVKKDNETYIKVVLPEPRVCDFSIDDSQLVWPEDDTEIPAEKYNELVATSEIKEEIKKRYQSDLIQLTKRRIEQEFKRIGAKYGIEVEVEFKQFHDKRYNENL